MIMKVENDFCFIEIQYNRLSTSYHMDIIYICNWIVNRSLQYMQTISIAIPLKWNMEIPSSFDNVLSKYVYLQSMCFKYF